MTTSDTGLIAFWISFPEDSSFPVGLGVTAWSLEDAYRLLDAHGYDFHRRAARVSVRERISVADLDYRHVVMNMGPIVVRGIWYPCLNVGYGAP